MKFLVMTDVHIGATNCLKEFEHVENFSNLIKLINSIPHQVPRVYLGDNIDLANCKKKEVQLYKELLNKIRYSSLFDGFVTGNHERDQNIGEVYVNNGVLFTHGDNEANRERWLEYRQKPHGAGFFKRGIIVNAIEFAEKIIERPMKKEFIANAVKRAKEFNCHTYVCGHFHVDKVTGVNVDGVRVITLPRGINIIDL